MKLHWDKTEIQKSLHLFVVILLSILFFFFLKNLNFFLQKTSKFLTILSPFFWGFTLAYILNRPLNFIEEKLDQFLLFLFQKKWKPFWKRVSAILIVLFLVFFLFYILSSFILPQILQSVTNLSSQTSSYIKSLEKIITQASNSLGNENMTKITASLLQKLSDIMEKMMQAIIPFLINASISLTSKVMNFILIFAVSIYVLFDKEKFSMQTKKVLYALFPQKIVTLFLKEMRLIDQIFGRYINGQLTDAVIVGSLTAITVSLFQLPEPFLIGTIVACTNIIPMVGPIIGAIPSTFIILMSGTLSQAFLFVILILIIQQIDGNILVPRVVGGSTGLSGFWVLFAVFVSGGLFGILGVLVCIPTLSVLLQILNQFFDSRLEKKGLPPDPEAYRHSLEENTK